MNWMIMLIINTIYHDSCYFIHMIIKKILLDYYMNKIHEIDNCMT